MTFIHKKIIQILDDGPFMGRAAKMVKIIKNLLSNLKKN
jgi:hypothetical protein